MFAGGQGARLLPYTYVLPKPLLPVGDKPILQVIIDQLRQAGIEEVVLATGHMSALIETYFGDGADHGVAISYHREREPLGTVGALAEIPEFQEPFIMMNGDVLTDTTLYDHLVGAHREARAAMTIATKCQEIDIDYGVLGLGEQLGAARRIERIDEKPRYSWPVSMGIYVVEPRVQRLVQPGRRMDFPDLITRMIDIGETVAAYEHDGYWMDIGHLHHLEAAVQDFETAADAFAGDTASNPRVRPDPAE